MNRILIFFFLFFSVVANAQEPKDLFEKGNSFYQKEEYQEAIDAYNQILKQGYESSDLYFNLGNAYYKSDNIPSAILNFEKAKKIDPSDEDIQFNLKLANLKVVDKIEPLPEVFYNEWFNYIIQLQSADRWAIAGEILFFISSLLGIIFLFSKKISLKKFVFGCAIVCFIFSLFLFLLAGAQHSYQNEQQGILTTSSAYIKSSPTEKGTDLFILHQGTKMRILDKVGDWLQIQIANGDKGWVKATDLEMI